VRQSRNAKPIKDRPYWETTERKPTFPLQKIDVVEQIKLTDGIEIRNQIDNTIIEKPKLYYGYE